jgi:hypothetical protein
VPITSLDTEGHQLSVRADVREAEREQLGEAGVLVLMGVDADDDIVTSPLPADPALN